MPVTGLVLERTWIQTQRLELLQRADRLKADWQGCQGALQMLAVLDAKLDEQAITDLVGEAGPEPTV